MLTLCYLGEANKFNLETGLNLLAVRKPPRVIPSYFVHVPQLSPSKDLFFQAQEWKRKYENKALWWDWYVEIFSKEMKERKDLVRALRRLEQVLQEKKKFVCSVTKNVQESPPLQGWDELDLFYSL